MAQLPALVDRMALFLCAPVMDIVPLNKIETLVRAARALHPCGLHKRGLTVELADTVSMQCDIELDVTLKVTVWIYQEGWLTEEAVRPDVPDAARIGVDTREWRPRLAALVLFHGLQFALVELGLRTILSACLLCKDGEPSVPCVPSPLWCINRTALMTLRLAQSTQNFL